jgi:cyanate permease
MRILTDQNKIFYGWVITAVTWLIYFSNVGLLLYGTPAINAGMMAAAGFSEATVGAAVSVCTACQGIFSPMTGIITRRKGVKGLLTGGSLILFAGSLLLSLFTPGKAGFILIYGLFFGIGMTLAGILTAQSLINNWFHRRKGLAMSIALSAGGIGGFIAPPLTGLFIDLGGWQGGWRFISFMCAVSVCISIFLIVNRPSDIGRHPDGAAEEPVESSALAKAGPGQIFRSGKIYAITAGIAARNILYYAVIGHLVLFLIRRGLSPPRAALSISVLSLCSLGGRFTAGIFGGKKIKARTFLALANFISAAGTLLLIPARGPLMFYLSAAGIGIGTGIGYIAQPMVIAAEFGAENFPLINGYIYPANYILSALGPLLAGIAAAAGGGYIPVFTVLALVSAAGGLILFFEKNLKTNKSALELPRRKAGFWVLTPPARKKEGKR